MLTSNKGPAFETSGAEGGTLREVQRDAEDCTRCDLYRDATHMVFGEGPANADIVFLGEQPGDKEDLAARPFVVSP